MIILGSVLVTVIIPNYNHADYLQQRIDSVLLQTYQNFEVILLDDSSTDCSRDILEQYRGNPKVTHVVYNERNSGSVFKQWQKGIELAKGDYIWIAESDDYAHPMFLEEMVPLLDSNNKVGFAYCDGFIVDERGNVELKTFGSIRNQYTNTIKWSNSYVKSGKEELKENLLRYCTVNNASGVLFRKSALINVNPFDIEFKYIGDWYCYIKLCTQYDITYLNKPLNYYREHAINASKNLNKDLLFVYEYFCLYNWVLKQIDFIDEKIIKSIFALKTRHNLIKNWSIRMRIYKKAHKLNSSLFWLLLRHNAVAPFIERLNKNIFHRGNLS